MVLCGIKERFNFLKILNFYQSTVINLIHHFLQTNDEEKINKCI